MLKSILYFVLSVCYFFLLIPTALISRISGKCFLRRDKDKSGYWKDVITDSAYKESYLRLY